MILFHSTSFPLRIANEYYLRVLAARTLVQPLFNTFTLCDVRVLMESLCVYGGVGVFVCA